MAGLARCRPYGPLDDDATTRLPRVCTRVYQAAGPPGLKFGRVRSGDLRSLPLVPRSWPLRGGRSGWNPAPRFTRDLAAREIGSRLGALDQTPPGGPHMKSVGSYEAKTYLPRLLGL